MRRLLVVALVLGGCGDNFNKATFDPQDAPSDTPMIDGPPSDVGPRGPNAFVIPAPSTGTVGSAYGLSWDNASQTLYITDDTSGANRLIKWTDANGFQTFATIPTGSTASTFAGITRLADGTFYVAAMANGVVTVSADGQTAGALTGLDTSRRRMSLALDPNGVIYESFFTGNMAGSQVGGVAAVAVAGSAATEATPITTSVALKKVIGILATTTDLLVCDQTAKKIYSIVIATGATTTYATPPSCDLLIKLPGGDIVTGGLTGGVYRITPSGTVTSIVSGMDQVRGVAYDPTLHRLFIVEFRTQMKTMPLLHVVPLDG